jgi:hypothetical protein
MSTEAGRQQIALLRALYDKQDLMLDALVRLNGRLGRLEHGVAMARQGTAEFRRAIGECDERFAESDERTSRARARLQDRLGQLSRGRQRTAQRT